MKGPRQIPKAPRRVPTIIEAMDGIFEPWFRGPSWDNWRTVQKANSVLPMSDSELDFFRSVSGGREPPRRRPRESWYVVARRGGKDSVISLLAGHAASTFDPRGILRPGERAVVACIAPDRETAKIIKNYITAFFETIPSLQKMVQRVTDDVVELSNMVDIAIMTSNWRTVRGRPILCCVLDECAMIKSDENASQDLELYAALLPGMSTIPQAQMFGISSPHAKSGLLYKKYAEHFGKDSDDVLIIQAASHIMNPTLDTRDRDRMMLEDPARARAEWYAEFRDDLVSFIDPAAVDLCVVKDRVELPPVPGIAYIAAVDPSGGSSDSMTLAIAHANVDCGILDLVREWQPPFSPQQVVSEIVEILRRYGISTVIGDAYAGQWAREPFRNHRVEYELAGITRSEAYLTMLPGINSRKIEFLDGGPSSPPVNRRLISQLCGLERRVARSGRDSVDHQRGGHDDVVNSAALALVAVMQPQSSADGWLAFMRSQLQRAGIDTDDVRASGPHFGFEFNAKPPEPVIKMFVPPAIVAGGGNGVPIDGVRHGFRFEGGAAYVELPRAAARQLLSYEYWRAANPGPTFDLLGESAT